LVSCKFLAESVDGLTVGVGFDRDVIQSAVDAVNTNGHLVNPLPKSANSGQYSAVVRAIGFQRRNSGFEIGERSHGRDPIVAFKLRVAPNLCAHQIRVAAELDSPAWRQALVVVGCLLAWPGLADVTVGNWGGLARELSRSAG
jgi:hypothetical protein